MSLENIYNKAKEAATSNAIEVETLKQREKELNLSPEEKIRMEAGEKAKWKIYDHIPEEKKVISAELLNIVKELKFNVLEYAKRTNLDLYHEYEPVQEYYSVEYNQYKFIIVNLHDYDIPEGIFAVYKVINTRDNSETRFFVDLGCRNTCEIKRENFMLLVNSDDEQEYLSKKYSNYIAIPDLLEQHGYTILDNRLEFGSDDINGHIKVFENVYVIPYVAGMNEIRVVVSNVKRWDVNSSNRGDNIGYYIEYNSTSDIKNIIDGIEAMKKHVNKEIGYLENGIYYTNKDIENIINITSKKDAKGNMPDAVNHYRVKINKVKQWDGRGYGQHRYISVLDGLELAVHFSFVINDSAQWSEGDIINYSDIVLKYDKKLDEDNCILTINNYQYSHDEEIIIPSDEEYVFEEIDLLFNNLNQRYLIDSIELKGSFTYLRNELIKYMNNMCKINNIDYQFEIQ